MAWSYEKHFLPFKDRIEWRRLPAVPNSRPGRSSLHWEGCDRALRVRRFMLSVYVDRQSNVVEIFLSSLERDRAVSSGAVDSRQVGTVDVFDDGGILPRLKSWAFPLEPLDCRPVAQPNWVPCGLMAGAPRGGAGGVPAGGAVPSARFFFCCICSWALCNPCWTVDR
jgi:hypothetical protein